MKFVCFKWTPHKEYRSKFNAHHVNVLRAMVARHYRRPHEFVCVTDDPTGIDPRVRTVPLWDDLSHVPSPHGGVNPSCYRRLKLFSDQALELVGERFIWMDLDVVIVNDITPIVDRKEDFVIWGEPLRTTPYNGSMVMLKAGARKQVWEDFDPATSPKQAQLHGMYGSDQAWISYKLGPNEARWTSKDGVYSFRLHVKPYAGQMPKGARIVFFEGHNDPWSPYAMRLSPWISDHYTLDESRSSPTPTAAAPADAGCSP